MNKIFNATVLMVLFTSCNKEAPTNGALELSGVPFLTGTQNLYEWTITTDSSGVPNYFERDSLTITVLSNTEQMFGFSNLTLLEIKSLKNIAGVSRVWYLNSKDSLCEIGYEGAGKVPLIMPKNSIRFNGYSDFTMPLSVKKYIAQRLQRKDSTTKREDYRIVYRFPLKINENWVSFTDPFVQKREVVGYEVVHVKAGQFYCTKIMTSIYFGGKADTALNWYDYVSKEGLILRTISYRGFSTTEQGPDIQIPISSVEHSELISKK